jgi:CRISPR/Cas system CSM-associated protein Csm3 (group 7 of RAMP superfamily)
LKKTLCESKFLINLTPKEPILVKKDKNEKINGRECAVWFEAFNPETATQSPCIPGSSLKGVIRSYIEKVLRSFGEGYACDPLNEEKSCSGIIQKLKDDNSDLSIVEVIKKLCHACRLFG